MPIRPKYDRMMLIKENPEVEYVDITYLHNLISAEELTDESLKEMENRIAEAIVLSASSKMHIPINLDRRALSSIQILVS